MLAAILSLEELLKSLRRAGRDALLPVLWDIQTAYGHIDADAVQRDLTPLRVPVSDIYGVISFYSLFARCADRRADHPGLHRSLVRASPGRMRSCTISAGNWVSSRAKPRRMAVIRCMHTTCLGLCEHAPAALISQRGEGEMSHAPVTDGRRAVDGRAQAARRDIGRRSADVSDRDGWSAQAVVS